MSDFFDSVNGVPHELARTRSYVVLSRPRAEALFADLLAREQRSERFQRLATALRAELAEVENQLMLALHELALARHEKEPQQFIREWLVTQRQASADAKERR